MHWYNRVFIIRESKTSIFNLRVPYRHLLIEAEIQSKLYMGLRTSAERGSGQLMWSGSLSGAQVPQHQIKIARE